jgi:GT2 family glycosyltransferase
MAIIPYPVELNDGEPITDIPRGVLSEGARRSVRNVGAVTGAVSAVERSKWDLVGGLDESLRVIGNDVDLCLRLAERGYDSVLDPHVTLTHVGKASRRGNDGDGDNFRMIARWNMLGPDGLIDPFYPDVALRLGDAR